MDCHTVLTQKAILEFYRNVRWNVLSTWQTIFTLPAFSTCPYEMGEHGRVHCTTRTLITALLLYVTQRFIWPPARAEYARLRFLRSTLILFWHQRVGYFHLFFPYPMSAMRGICHERLSRHNDGEQLKIAGSSSSCSCSHPQFPILRPNLDDQFAHNALRSVLQTVVPQHISVAEQLNGHQALATLWSVCGREVAAFPGTRTSISVAIV